MASEYTGTCSCGQVHFELSGDPHTVFNCHCTICRKMNGTAFTTYVVFDKTALKVTEGEGNIQAVEVGTHGIKHFCRRCGSPLYGLHRQANEICLIPLGAIDTGGALVPTTNVFCRSRLGWVHDLDKMINYDTAFAG